MLKNLLSAPPRLLVSLAKSGPRIVMDSGGFVQWRQTARSADTRGEDHDHSDRLWAGVPDRVKR